MSYANFYCLFNNEGSTLRYYGTLSEIALFFVLLRNLFIFIDYSVVIVMYPFLLLKLI